MPRFATAISSTSAWTSDCRLLSPAWVYTWGLERKIFWLLFIVLGLVADWFLPVWWAIVATFPIGAFSWWVAYRSEWFQ